jgi:hypothetical protein
MALDYKNVKKIYYDRQRQRYYQTMIQNYPERVKKILYKKWILKQKIEFCNKMNNKYYRNLDILIAKSKYIEVPWVEGKKVMDLETGRFYNSSGKEIYKKAHFNFDYGYNYVSFQSVTIAKGKLIFDIIYGLPFFTDKTIKTSGFGVKHIDGDFNNTNPRNLKFDTICKHKD